MKLTCEQVLNLMYLAGYLEVTDYVRSCETSEGIPYMRIRTLTGWYTARNVVTAVKLLLECHVERYAK